MINPKFNVLEIDLNLNLHLQKNQIPSSGMIFIRYYHFESGENQVKF